MTTGHIWTRYGRPELLVVPAPDRSLWGRLKTLLGITPAPPVAAFLFSCDRCRATAWGHELPRGADSPSSGLKLDGLSCEERVVRTVLRS